MNYIHSAAGAYEALQLYRSKAIRQKSKNDIEGAIQILATGAITLLENKYDNAGSELSNLFLDTLVANSKDLSSDTGLRDLVYKIDSAYTVEDNNTLNPKRVVSRLLMIIL